MNVAPHVPEAVPSSSWWSIVLRGILAFAFGVITLAQPGSTASVLILVFAAFAVVDGVTSLIAAARKGRQGQRWTWFLFEGIVSIAAGVVAFGYPAVTFGLLLLLVAIRAIVLGALEIGGAIAVKGLDSRWLWALTGLLSIVFGLLLLSHPFAGALAVVWMIGAYAIVAGIMTFAFGLHVRGLKKHEEELHPIGGHPATT